MTVRQVGQESAHVLADLDQLVWAEPARIPREAQLAKAPVRAGFVASVDDEDAGIAGSWDLELAVPDGGDAARLVPAEGLTWVGVHPDHRRRGVLTALVRHHLRWTRGVQGRALAALKASEPGIYGRYGYGVATSAMRSSLPRGTTFAAPDHVVALADATRTRVVDDHPDHAARLHQCWLDCATTRPGNVVRSLPDVTRMMTDVPEERDRERNRLMWATRDGRDVGFAVVRRQSRWVDEMPSGEADVMVVASADPAARLALARRLTDLDLVSTTTWWLTVDDPLAVWQPSLRPLRGAMTDALWLRLVDLPAAVAQRGHSADVDLTVEVTDVHLPENAGTWRWRATGGEARLERHDGPGDLALDVADLAHVWLGGQALGARAAAGYVVERRAGAVAELDAALRTPVGPVNVPDF